MPSGWKHPAGGRNRRRQHGGALDGAMDQRRVAGHRAQVVAGPPEVASRDRYSIAFFFDPDKDAIIATHPACLARTGREARYAPISARDFVMMKIMEMQKTASEAGVKAAY